MPPVNETTGAMNEAEGSFDNSNIYENVSEAMTFDNLDAEDDGPITQGDEDSDDDSEEEESDDDEDEEGEKLGSEELKLLNDTDGKGKKEEKKPKKEEEDDEDEEESEESEEAEEEGDKAIEKAPETQGKKLRIKIGDEHFSLDSSAKMKVKIDGQNQEVTVQDLINNYSGKVAYDKKFTEIGNEKKALLQEKQQVTAKAERISSILSPIVETLQDPLKNPIEALVSLAENLDSTGKLAHDIEKRMLEANLDLLVELSAMGPEAQQAFFVKKQNDRLLKFSEKRIQSESEAQKSNQLRAHVDQLREAYKVSVDQYSESFEELKKLLPGKEFTHEQVVDWASQKPFHGKVEKILAPYLDEINDSDYSGIVASLSRSLRDGKLSEAKIQELVKAEYGVPASVKELNTKLNIGKKKPSKEAERKDPEKFETFDDFED